MEHDIFFSISQTPDHNGHVPDEATMLRHYFQQLACADELGFGTGWIAQAHLSPRHKNPTQNQSFLTGKVKSACARISLSSRWNRFAVRRGLKLAVPSSPSSPQAAPSLKRSESPTYSAFTGLMKRKQENFTSVSQQAALSSWLALTALSAQRCRGGRLANPSWTNFHGGCRDLPSLVARRRDQFRDDSTDRIDSRKFRSDEDWLAVQDAAVEFEALSQRPQVHIPSRYVFEDLKIVPSSFRHRPAGARRWNTRPRSTDLCEQHSSRKGVPTSPSPPQR